jgi:hypothetical protein
MAKEYAVQVTMERQEKLETAPLLEKSAFKRVNVDLLITEILRYAGSLDVIKGRDEGSEMVFNLYRTGGKGTEMWARMNAERIRSFGIKASPVLLNR